ncbi:MAG: LPXTG cell wall anchor domain-containing protein, partial [Oscillospiraceae bacterium]|nr:LPXTG cell wall anchor domain-containing protein [Oscillospiraceae bacterium]
RALSSVTNVGSYNIKAEYSGLTPGKYSVTVANQGRLTISPFKLTLTAVSASKTYDGSTTFDKKSNVSATALLSGHSFRSGDGVKFSIYDSKGNLIKNGPVDVGTYTKKVTEVHIIDSAGNEVTSNYDITRIDGTLSILSGSGSPRTGDNNNLALWIGLLAASAVLIAAVVFTLLRKKKTARKPSASSKAETNAKTRKPRQ